MNKTSLVNNIVDIINKISKEYISDKTEGELSIKPCLTMQDSVLEVDCKLYNNKRSELSNIVLFILTVFPDGTIGVMPTNVSYIDQAGDEPIESNTEILEDDIKQLFENDCFVDQIELYWSWCDYELNKLSK